MKNTIRFDWAIKRLLRNKANFGILEGFLSELLAEDIVIESILESESNKHSVDNKMNRVDLLVKNTNGELIIVEVQSEYTQDYLLRILFGTSKLIVDNMDSGMENRKVKKIISVNIVYFDLGHGEDYIYHGTTSLMGMYQKDILRLSKQEQIVFKAEQIMQLYPEYYIIKVNRFNDIAKNTLDEWINFLKNEVVKEGTKAKGLEEAKEKMDILKLSKEEMKEYENDLDAWRDYTSSMNTHYMAGAIHGEANKEKYADEKVKLEKIELAKKLLKRNTSISDIIEFTGLSDYEINNLPVE